MDVRTMKTIWLIWCLFMIPFGTLAQVEDSLSVTTPQERTQERKLELTNTDILSKLYVETAGVDWSTKLNWMLGDPCIDGWYGVECYLGPPTTVVKIDLSANNLTGYIPTQLGLLTSMIVVDYSQMKLNSNSLIGPIPSELGQMTALGYGFDLSENSLSGTIPSELGRLTALTSIFNLYSNSLSGSIPSELGELTMFAAFFQLYSNQLSNAIPTELARLTGLVSNFNLYSNNFCPSDIPAQVSALSLQVSVGWGMTPDNADNLCVYDILSILYNETGGSSWSTNSNWMSGEPCPSGSWYAVTCNSNDNVAVLNLWNNNLHGTLPSELGQLTELKGWYSLYLNSNQLQGSIPSQLGLMTTQTRGFFLDNNLFSGRIPSQLGQLSLMYEYFYLYSNALTGPLPSQFGQLSALRNRVWLNDNSISGSLPSELGQLTQMTGYFWLDDNKFTNHLPSELGLMTAMYQHLYLYSNSFSGTIPSEIGQWTAMFDNFGLYSNNFTGSLPSQFGQWTKIGYQFLVYSNSLSGEIPTEMALMTNLVSNFQLQSNRFCGEISAELSALSSQVTGVWKVEEGNSLGTACCVVYPGTFTCAPTSVPTVLPTITPIPTSQPSFPPTSVLTSFVQFQYEISVTSSKGSSYTPSSDEKLLLLQATTSTLNQTPRNFAVSFIPSVRKRKLLVVGTATWGVSFDLEGNSQNVDVLVSNATDELSSTSYSSLIALALNVSNITTTSAASIVLTRNPTLPPTSAPSPSPTPLPTTVPIPLPTLIPSPLPTTIPTIVPTPLPTLIPTTSPLPSFQPTQIPSPVPTLHCGAGHYLSSGECFECPFGKYSNNDTAPFATNCRKCSAGKYNSQLAQSSCTDCAAGKLSAIDRASCGDCYAGQYSSNDIECVGCEPGKYAPQALADSCLVCTAGSFTNNATKATTCSSCDSGKFSNSSAIICESCEKGKYSTNGAYECTDCAIGSISKYTSSSSCTACGAGKYAAVVGLTNCSSCAQGQYQGSTGQGSCLNCDLGKYVNTNAATSCDSCTSGKVAAFKGLDVCDECSPGKSSSEGASVCVNCSIGFYNPIKGQGSCTACAAGSYASSVGTVNCTLCSIGTYQSATGQVGCSVCDEGKVASLPKTTSCTSCPTGFTNSKLFEECSYADEGYYLAPPKGLDSWLCPDHSTCDIGGLQTPIPSNGYWVDHSSFDHVGTMYRCSRLTCRGGNASSLCWHMNHFNSSYCTDASVQCMLGAEGPLCGSCVDGYVYNDVSRVCETCVDSNISSMTTLFALSFIAMLFLFYHLKGDELKMDNLYIVQYMKQFEGGCLKVVWNTYQIISSVSYSIDISYPNPFNDMLGAFSVFALNFLSTECYIDGNDAYYQTIYLWSITPIIVGIFILLIGFLRICYHVKDKDNGPKTRNAIINQHIWLLLLLSFLVLPSVSTKQLQAFDCVTLDSGEKFLRLETSINCESGEYYSFISINIFFLIIYQMIPVLWLVLLVRKRHILNPLNAKDDEEHAIYLRNNSPELHKLSFLFQTYKCNKWWFEIADMYRRITFVALLPLVSPNASIRASFGIVLALVSVVFFREQEPYRVRFTNDIAQVAQLSIFVTFYFALSIETGTLITFGLDGVRLGVFLMICNLLVFIMVMWFTYDRLRVERKEKQSKLEKAMQSEWAIGFSATKFDTSFHQILQHEVPSSNTLVFYYTARGKAREARNCGLKVNALYEGIPFTLRRPHDTNQDDFNIFGDNTVGFPNKRDLKHCFPNEEVLALSLPRSLLDPLPGYEHDDGLCMLSSNILAAMRPSSFFKVVDSALLLDGILLLPPQAILRSYQIMNEGPSQDDSHSLTDKQKKSHTLEYDSPRVSLTSKVQPLNSIELYLDTMVRIRQETNNFNCLPLYHYTSLFVADLILQSGLRMSTQGQGDGGVYVSTQGPASYGIGTKEYEERIIKDCFGVERMEEYKGKGKLDVVIIYACAPAVFEQTPGGRDNARMVTKSNFGTFSLADSSGNYFLRPDRIMAAFYVNPSKLPKADEKELLKLKNELNGDLLSIRQLKETENKLNFNFTRISSKIALLTESSKTEEDVEGGVKAEEGESRYHHSEIELSSSQASTSKDGDIKNIPTSSLTVQLDDDLDGDVRKALIVSNLKSSDSQGSLKTKKKKPRASPVNLSLDLGPPPAQLLKGLKASKRTDVL